jgi:hypothetical protein
MTIAPLLYDLMRDGELKVFRLGRNATRIPVAEIEAYIARKLAGQSRRRRMIRRSRTLAHLTMSTDVTRYTSHSGPEESDSRRACGTASRVAATCRRTVPHEGKDRNVIG